MSLTVEGKVCINNKIDHVVSCINIETIAEPINTIISREHCVKHEILKVGQVLSGKEVCFVHDGIIARIGENLNPSCATLSTGFILHFPPTNVGSILLLLQSIHQPNTYHNSHSCYHKELPS